VRLDGLFVAALLVLASVPGAPAQELTERATFRGVKSRVERAALSPDGKMLATAAGTEVKLWDVAAGKEIVSLGGLTNSLYSLAFSADGKRLASGGWGPLQVWDVDARKEIASFKESGEGAYVVALNRDGTMLAAVGQRQVKLLEVASGKELASFKHHVPLTSWLGAAFSSDLATLAVGNFQDIDLWDTTTGKERATLSEHRGAVGCMAWGADGKTLIASSTRLRYEGRIPKWKGDLKLWDVAAGKERATLPGPFGTIHALAANPDGKTLALLDTAEPFAEPELKLVDVDTRRQQAARAPPGCSFLSVHFTTEGRLLVTGKSADALRLWQVSLPKRDVKP
jgi:WD40 repeat protein